MKGAAPFLLAEIPKTEGDGVNGYDERPGYVPVSLSVEYSSEHQQREYEKEGESNEQRG